MGLRREAAPSFQSPANRAQNSSEDVYNRPHPQMLREAVLPAARLPVSNQSPACLRSWPHPAPLGAPVPGPDSGPGSRPCRPQLCPGFRPSRPDPRLSPRTGPQPPPGPTLPAEALLPAAALGEEAVKARVGDVASEDASQGQSQADGLHRLHHQRRQQQQAQHSLAQLHTRTRAALRVPEPTAGPRSR